MIKACIFDLGGTIVDKYSLSPLVSLQKAFSLKKIFVPNKLIIQDMGTRKFKHIQLLCNENLINTQFRIHNDRDISTVDMESIYNDFNDIQTQYMKLYLNIIPETCSIMRYLRQSDIKSGITTGFNKEQMDIAVNLLRKNHITIDSAVSSDFVSRPHPYMIYTNMKQLQIDDPKKVIKIDDTCVGIQEGINAGCYTVGVARWSVNMHSGSCGQLSHDSLTKENINHILFQSRKTLQESGADFVIDNCLDLPYKPGLQGIHPPERRSSPPEGRQQA